MSEVNRISNVNQNNVNSTITSKASANKASFSSFLGESKSLDEIFGEAAKKYNVSEGLLKAVGKAESNFRSDAVSRCGAQGVMQLMPSTAASLGVTDSFDAEQNIMGGAKYISGLLKKYDGNTKLALAAYNAGSGNVAKYGGIPPFKETQNYVVKVTNYMNQGVSTDGAVAVASQSSKVNSSITTALSNKVTPATGLDTVEYQENNITQDFDALFSYDDYMRFLDEFTKQDDKKEEENPTYLASKNINYSAPVMNLLNQIL